MTSSLLLVLLIPVNPCAAAIAAMPFTLSTAGAPVRFEPKRPEGSGAVQFLGRAPNLTVLLEPGGVTAYLLPAADAGAAHIVRMVAVRARPGVTPTAENLLPSATNYLSDDGALADPLPNYGRVRYSRLYPGIDLTWHSRGGALEYEFSVAPEADPARIRLRIEGARRSYLDAAGDLILETSGGRLRQRRPVAFQERDGRREVVAVGYSLRGGTLGFRLGQYDREQPLIIDPELSFSSYLGGSGFDAAYGVAVDSSGNIYITGETASADFPAPAGSSQPVRYNRDVFVTKLSPDGRSVLYTTILSGRGNDAGRAIAVDSSGSAYITGSVGDAGFPVTSGALKTSYGGSGDAFIARLDPSGRLVYSTYLGGGGADVGTGIAIDSTGNAYVTGYTSSLAFPATPGAPQSAHHGGFYDAFIVKLNSAGAALVYSTLLGGSASDLARAIGVNQSGEACVAGYTESRDLSVRNAIQAVAGAGGDAIVGCLNAAGNTWNWLTYFGGRGRDEANALALDASGNVYVTGSTFSDDFRTTAGAFQTSKRAQYDAFAVKLDATGARLLYSTLLGGNGPDTGAAIAIDSAGRATVAGFTASPDFPVRDAWQSAYAGSYDVFVTRLTADASVHDLSSYFGGSGDDRLTALALDSTGNAFLTGLTSSASLATTAAAIQAAAPVPYNAFFARVGANETPVPVSIAPASGVGNTQTFTATISDANGFIDIAKVYLLVGTSAETSAGACSVQYDQAANHFTLNNDAGTGWTAGVTPGSSGSLSNSQCTLNAAGSSVAGEGDRLTLNVALTFNAGFGGAKALYVGAVDKGGMLSGWKAVGSWIVPDELPAQPPVAVSVNPVSGNGYSQTFTAVVSDADGRSDIAAAYFLVGTTLQTGAGSCFVQYHQPTNRLVLQNDAGTGWTSGVAPGGSGSVANSQCTLSAAGSSVVGEGDRLTLHLALTFAAAFGGTKALYLGAVDNGSLFSGWKTAGSWIVPASLPPQPPSVISVSPASGSGNTQTFSAVVSDINGRFDIAAVYFLVGTTLQTGAGACFVQYHQPTNRLMLQNDAGTAWTAGVMPGDPGGVSNSQCALSAAASSIVGEGDKLTLTLSLTFAGGFGGTKTLYLGAVDNGSLFSGWKTAGTWTISSALPQPPAAVSVSPASGAGNTQVFTAVVSDPNGRLDIAAVYFLVGTTIQTAAGACFVQYHQPTNRLMLQNDAGTGWMASVTPGGSGIVSNTQCALSASGSTVASAGDTLTIKVALTFSAGFGGTKTLYLGAVDSGSLFSGWRIAGSWSVR